MQFFKMFVFPKEKINLQICNDREKIFLKLFWFDKDGNCPK